MGVSTDAKLAYGVDLGDDGIPAWLRDEFGVPREREDEDAGDTWELTKALNAAGLDLEHHCSDTHTMYVLCVKDSATTAWRGYPKTIEALDVPPEWGARWERVKRAGEPRWLLFSWWG